LQAGVTQFDQDSVHPAVRSVLDELMLVSGRVVDDCPGWQGRRLRPSQSPLVVSGIFCK